MCADPADRPTGADPIRGSDDGRESLPSREETHHACPLASRCMQDTIQNAGKLINRASLILDQVGSYSSNLLSEDAQNEVVLGAFPVQDEIPFFLQEREATAEAERKSDTLKFRIGQPNN